MTVWAKDKLLSVFEKGVGYQMTGVFFCDMIVKNIKRLRLRREVMKKIIVYEMSFGGIAECGRDIFCILFREEYWNEYMQIYNECFHEMRKNLEIEPTDFYSDYSQMKEKADSTYLCLQNGVIAGAVSCYGNELDDLIVNKSFQRQGLGEKLLLWGIKHIKEQGYDEVILHVAEWNQNAVRLYLKNGFVIRKRERVR